MKNYLLLIYNEKLSEYELNTISNLCHDNDVEEIEVASSCLIHEAFFNIYDTDSSRVCYRLFAEEFSEAIFLLEKRLLYIGKFNSKIEEKLIELANLTRDALSIVNDMNTLEWAMRKFSDKLQKRLGVPARLTSKDVKKFLDKIDLDCSFVNEKVNALFAEHQLFAVDIYSEF